jgi:hypothetical protein
VVPAGSLLVRDDHRLIDPPGCILQRVGGPLGMESTVLDVTCFAIKYIQKVFLQGSPRASASAESVLRVGAETP